MNAAAWFVLAGIGVFIGLLIAYYPLEQRRRRRHWRRQIADRQRARAELERHRAAELRPGQYRCTSCGRVCDAKGNEEMLAEVLAAMQSLPVASGPPCIICDDCYRTITGEERPT